MYRVAILLESGETFGKDCKDIEEAYEFILSFDKVKRYRILCKKTGEIIETEKGKK